MFLINVRTCAFVRIFESLPAERKLVTFGLVREKKMGILQLLLGS